MDKLYSILLLLSIISCSTANGQHVATINIFDNETRQPLEGVSVSFKNTGVVVLTNKDGSIKIKNFTAPTVAQISSIGYQLQTITIVEGLNSVALVKGSITLQDIVLRGSVDEGHFNTISKIDLQLRPARSSQDLLKIVPGLFIAQHAGGGKAEQIFLRGFDIDHGTDVQVSVDGLPVNMVSHGHGQGYADLHFVIPELVNNVDFGKGPYYTDKGNLNTSGYVSLNTIKSIDKNKVQVEGGQFNSLRLLGMTNLLKNTYKQNAYLATEYVYSDGPFLSPQHFNRVNIFGKYNRRLSDNATVTFSASAFSSKWDASGQVPQRAVEAKLISRFGAIDNTEGGYTNRYNANALFNFRLKNNHQIESQIFYSRYNFKLYSNFTFFLRDTINGDQIRQTDERDIVGTNTRYIISSTKGTTNFKTTFGLNTRSDKTYNTELSYTKNRVTTLKQVKLGNISESNVSLYLDKRIETKRWLFNVGIRADYLHFNYFDKLTPLQVPAQSKAIISPKLNIQYNVGNKTQVYFKAGKGFHSNDTRVVVANNGQQVLPPAYGSDLGIVLHPSKKLLVNAALWYLFLQQEFVYVGDEGITEPSGKTRRFGLDVSGRYQVSEHIIADLNVNLAKARFTDEVKGKNFVPLAPAFTSTGGLSYKSKQAISGSLRYKYIKNRPANELNSVVAKGYFINDLVISYSKNVYEFGIVVENLMNAKWNEAQFDTESRLKDEPFSTSELHFTPGTPFSLKFRMAVRF